MFRTLTIAILVICLLGCPLRALAVSYDSLTVESKQLEVDALLTELNELAAEERMLCAMEESGFSMASSNYRMQLESVNSRQATLENKLERFGVHTIDPNNSADMAQLAEVVVGNTNVNATTAIPDPPNLNTLASCYTLSQYNSSTVVNGVEYNFSYIFVTDNKGYNGSPLTVSQNTNVLIGKEITLLKDLLDYQFSFAFSSYLGSIPGSWIADWAIGSAFTILNSLNENSTVSYIGNGNIYNMSMLSVTQMLYCYVYLPNAGWIQCGAKASNVSYARAETLVANIGGTAYSEAKNYPTVSSYTGIAAVSYAANYVNGNGCDIDRIGSFCVNTYGGKTVWFTPGFADYPMYLV